MKYLKYSVFKGDTHIQNRKEQPQIGKKKQSTGTVNDTGFLVKSFLKSMFKELKKTTSEEQRCENYFLAINRSYKKKRPSRNSRVEKYNDWNKQFTRGVQQQIWTVRIITKLEDSSIKIM